MDCCGDKNDVIEVVDGYCGELNISQSLVVVIVVAIAIDCCKYLY